MLSLLLAPLAFAGWTQTAQENGCTFFLGTVEGNVQPVRAECDWPIAPDKLHKLVGKIEDHDLYFSSVEVCDVLGPSGNGKLGYQRHVASGISDREVVLIFTEEAIPNGKRYAWTKAPDQSKARGEGVPTVLDTGKWEVSSNASGGSHVVYELRYDAGGSVPGFVVRWFQGAGTRALVGELRTWAETH